MKRDIEASNKRRGRRRTTAQRARILRDIIWQSEHNTSVSYSSLLEKYEVSDSSLRRWAVEFQNEFFVKNDSSDQDPISKHINNLCFATQIGTGQLEESALRFAAWIRFPSNTSYQNDLIIPMKISTMDVSHGVLLKDLDEADRKWLTENISVDRIRRFYSYKYYGEMVADVYPIDNESYFVSDFVSDIVWFILSFKTKSADSRKSASLNKAFRAFSNGLFEDNTGYGPRRARELWRQWAVIAPFSYVDTKLLNVGWTLDPNEPDMRNKFVSIVSSPDKIERFMRMALGVWIELREKLDRRALHGIAFPGFPSELEPLFVAHAPLPDDVESYVKN